MVDLSVLDDGVMQWWCNGVKQSEHEQLNVQHQ